jgi:hypothetical protein
VTIHSETALYIPGENIAKDAHQQFVENSNAVSEHVQQLKRHMYQAETGTKSSYSSE